MTELPRVLVVAGPTAVGKSALALDLAEHLDGEIVNLDSVQMYRGFDIGSAKIPLHERRGVPHHLLDHFDPAHPVHVMAFREEALKAIDGIRARGRLPILVGGSGMYLTILLHGIAEVPHTTSEVRERVAAMEPSAMMELLTDVDPDTACRLHQSDVQRVSRALEIWFLTGERPSEIHARHRFSESLLSAVIIVPSLPRDVLYDRINRRSEEMIKRGLIEETRALYERYGDSQLFDSIGYRQARDVLLGALPVERVAEEISLATRRFAKRQMTYWRNEPRKRGWSVQPAVPTDGEHRMLLSSKPARKGLGAAPIAAMSFEPDGIVRALSEALLAKREGEDTNGIEVWFVSMGANAPSTDG